VPSAQQPSHAPEEPSGHPAEPSPASGSWSPPVDNHVHTQYSWDAPREASMARSCEQAVAAGLPGLAFTDHLDFTTWIDGDQIGALDLDPHRYNRMHLIDLDGYYATLQECRQRYPELRILSGVEIGEAHLWAASAAATVARTATGDPAGPDRILGSLHAIPCNGRLTAADELYRLMPPEEVMRRYLGELLRLVEGSDLFQVLAHIDFPRRMWPWSAGPYSEQAFEAEYRAVLRALAAGDRVLEVNTKSPLLSAELVGWWRESGGRAVSFGSDAHQPWRVGDKFKLAVDMVEAAGFRAGRDRFDFWRR
jgi:histidinol-phosphatase (PHP family)